MKTRTIRNLFLLAAVLLFGFTQFDRAQAQEEDELTLRLNKDFGFAAGAKMQGTFSMRISGPENLEKVVFYIDGEAIGEDTDAPFGIRFNTDSYATGQHSIHATGFTSDGREIHSNELQMQFVTAGEGMESGLGILGILLAVIVGAMVISLLIPTVFSKNKYKNMPPGTPRNYGHYGGTICPKCQRPFSMHMFGMNLVVGRLDRCDYCGKWSFVRRMPIEMLRTAEQAELERAQVGERVEPLSEEERLRKELEGSRFTDV